jgi:hypothetical protein
MDCFSTVGAQVFPGYKKIGVKNTLGQVLLFIVSSANKYTIIQILLVNCRYSIFYKPSSI